MTKKHKNIIFSWKFWTIISVILVILTALNIDSDTNNEVKTATGFNIVSFKVKLDVHEDNVIDVTENITVNFLNSIQHGIYRYVPKWSEYTPQNRQTIKRKSLISNYQAVGENYRLDTVNGKARITIGDADEYVARGEKEYTIKYTYNMGKDPYKNFDELIFHAFGDYWGTEINNASIEINMPKSIEGYNINFYQDKYRESNITKTVDYYIVGNTLYASYDKPLTKSLTVDIELPDGYFVGGSWFYRIWPYIEFIMLTIAVLGITCYTIYKWYKYGKDYPKESPTIEFLPPDNLSAAEIGYIYNKKQPSKKLTIALIIQLASRGYIQIDELNEDQKKIQITKLDIKNIKSNMTDIEKTVYKRLFEEKDTIILSEHKSFYKAFDSVNDKLKNNFKNKVYDQEARNQRRDSILRSIIIFNLNIMSLCFLNDLSDIMVLIYLLLFLCNFINLFFIIIMNRKTRYGEYISAKVAGFREFLITAEKSRIEALVEENPNYFYDILPYTYVLNISKKWIKKFENIPIPNVDMGTFDYMSDSSFHSLYTNVYIPASSSGSSSSCGGGCSSCGGGCSSCGGGGSW